MTYNKQNDLKYVSAVSSGAGAVAGATATSGMAISAAGAGATGLTGYLIGTGRPDSQFRV